MKKPNALIFETSPYLLQHAYNPVHWQGWNENSLKLARESEKPLLISIGYSACHWCHVMEQESFEDPEVARVMNTHFIPIKVDREERPDVDHIYMDALQIMTGSGGWPLNIIALPNGKPFWGATYLPREKWLNALKQLAELYRTEPRRILEYAEDLTNSLHRINIPETNTSEITVAKIGTWINLWKTKFDLESGGTIGAPKFMMPVRLQTLMHWGEITGDEQIREHVKLSLQKMAFGGLYDHLEGGFARYAVDTGWHVPHFEKMLYDNAQLMSLYAQAYACYKDPFYKEVVAGCLNFIQSQLASPNGGYFAAMDADSINSEGKLEEGAYYIWTESEIREILGGDFDIFAEAYNINSFGRWEKDHYVLIRREGDSELAKRLNLSIEELKGRLSKSIALLARKRAERAAPSLDNKRIVSWNGLLLTGLSDAYRYCGIESARDAAIQLGEWLKNQLQESPVTLPHIAEPSKPENIGFLEDYACVIAGFIQLYHITWDISWMKQAQSLCTEAIEHYSGANQALFYFESRYGTNGIRRTLETTDNVIPASNSIMAKNLFLLGSFFGNTPWKTRAEAMLHTMSGSITQYSTQHCNWIQLAFWFNLPFLEIAISSPTATEQIGELNREYVPNCILAASDKASELYLFKERYDKDHRKIYVCTYGRCNAPSTDIREVIAFAKKQLRLNSTL